jgi:pimeloyl-ACP methyl ester carboxylesterase
MPLAYRPGTRIAYEVAGEGPPVLFIQGVGVPGAGWRPQIDGLVGRFRCAWFDHRGIGASGPVAGRLSIATLVDDTLAVLDALGWEDAHLVGHSMGGILAHQVALDHRARVRSLGLLCTFPRGKDAARLTPSILWLGLRTRLGTRRMRRHAFLGIVSPASERAANDLDVLAARYGEVFGRDLADQPPVALDQVRAMSRHDDSHRLGELCGLRTLIVSATEDPISLPEFGHTLAARITPSQFHEIPDAAHGVTITHAAAINGLLEQHLSA